MHARSLKQDKHVLMFELIDGRITIPDLAVYFGWSIEVIKCILAQLASESVIDMVRGSTLTG